MEKKCIGPCGRTLDISCFGSKGEGLITVMTRKSWMMSVVSPSSQRKSY